jgi:hypothetical protein
MQARETSKQPSKHGGKRTGKRTSKHRIRRTRKPNGACSNKLFYTSKYASNNTGKFVNSYALAFAAGAILFWAGK